MIHKLKIYSKLNRSGILTSLRLSFTLTKSLDTLDTNNL